MKFGAEYRRIQSDFQFLGSTEISYNGINEFIDNRPNTYAVTQDSPVFEPQQYYLVGFAQDTWRIGERLTLDLGMRYDYYSVVKEAQGRAKPFFVEENEFGTDPNNFYDSDTNNFAPRLSAAYMLTSKTVLRAGFGYYYGPGQFEDRIQPIENYITRNRVQASDVPNNGLAYPIDPALLKSLLSIRGYTHDYPAEYNIQYGVSLQQELPGAINLSVGYTGSEGRDMFLRGVGNVLDPVTRVRPVPTYGQIDFKTGGCVDDVRLAGAYPIGGCGTAKYDALQVGVTRRFQSGFTGGFNYQYSRNKGTTQGSNEAATAQNTFDFDSEYGINPQDIPHTFNGSLVYQIPGQGALTGGWRVGAIVNARSGVPHQRDHQPAGQRHGQRRDGDQHPRRQQPRHAAPGPGSGSEPVPGERRRALAQSGGVRRTAARDLRQPAPELPARPVVRAVRPDGVEGRPLHAEPEPAVPGRGVQHRQPPELREPGNGAAQRRAGCAVHRRAGRHLRVHARAPESHGGSRHGSPGADFGSLSLLVQDRPCPPRRARPPPTAHRLVLPPFETEVPPEPAGPA